MGRRRALGAAAIGGVALSLLVACGRDAPAPHLSEPIVHIGANTADPRLMETAILVVMRAPFETVRAYVSDPTSVESYLAFVTDSTVEPLAGGKPGELRVSLRMSVADVFGVSISGMPLGLRWRTLQSSDSVFAVAFERIDGAYEHLTGSIYAANLFDGSTAAMLRMTTRSGFVPEAVREPLARWHADASLRKLSDLLESTASP
jgi:hypothetical protein